MAIKVAIVEDHKEFREAVAFMLNSTEGFTCTGKFGTVEEAIEEMKEPEVVLMDIHLPGISGIDGIKFIKEKYPQVFILMLTVFEDEENIFRAVLEGADGYMLKKTPPLRILQAIEDVTTGGAPMTPVIARQAINLFRKYAPQKNDNTLLSNREQEILKLIIEGMSNDEISGRLFISIQTVRNHIRHIYEKLHVHSKSQAVVTAIRKGII